jgi:hypothetical protein
LLAYRVLKALRERRVRLEVRERRAHRARLALKVLLAHKVRKETLDPRA